MTLTTLGTFTVDTVTDEIILNGHGRYANSRVQFSSTGTLPAGLSGSTTYYCIVTSANRFQVSLTAGGGVVDITDAGTGTHTAFVEVDGTDSGLLTYASEGQSDVWENNGAERGLMTYDSPGQSDIWSNSGAEKGLQTYASDDQGPRWANSGAEKGLQTYGATAPELEAHIVGSTTISAELDLIDIPIPPSPPFPPVPAPGVLPPATHIPCSTALNDCLPCNDDPVLNISAEDADSDRFLFNFNLTERPNLGFRFEGLGCQRWCYSDVSQLDADLCAILQTVECINNQWMEPPQAGGGGGGIIPVGVPPSLFFNTEQTCSTTCPDGSTFGWVFPAGAVANRNQVQANRIAHSLACRLARTQRICITTSSLPEVCLDATSSYQTTLRAQGGTPIRIAFWNIGFMPAECHVSIGDVVPYLWSVVSGALPSGLTLDRCSGIIRGDPAESGTFSIRFRATDAIGSFQERTLELRVIKIVNESELPEGSNGTFYLENLDAQPSEIDEQQWSLVSGFLPMGLELTNAGVLSGTPTESGTFNFTLQVKIGAATCEKMFTLVIGHDYGNVTPDVFSAAVSFWNSGMTVPAGNYRISYVTGAMEYAPCFPPCWSVNTVGAGYHVKYNGGAGDVLFPAATTGRLTEPEVYVDNAGKFIDIVHTGGTIGIMLVDAPYGDNVAGSPNPTFNLVRL